jgi:hypothetical protein
MTRYNNCHNSLQLACQNLTLTDVVFGLIMMEFQYGRVPLSDVYRRIGAKLSLEREVIRTCLMILSERGFIEFYPLGKAPYVKLRCNYDKRRNRGSSQNKE